MHNPFWITDLITWGSWTLNSKEEIKYLTTHEWTSLETLQKNNRDQLIIDLLYTTGCTVNELINIKIKDISFKEQTLAIHSENSRNHEPRIVFLSERVSKQIKLFLSQDHPNNTEFLIATRQSPQMTTKRVRQIVQGLTKKSKLEKHNPQILRYTHIVHAFQKGVPIPAIQKQVGIKRSRAIQIFNLIKSEPQRDAYDAFLR